MLYIIGTPIGNLGDLSKRAIDSLVSSDIVFAEDTRTALKLLSYLNIKKPVKSYYKDNEKNVSPEIIRLLEDDKNVALISEAGMPCISDPGSVVISEVIKRNIQYEIIQGPTAFVHALIASGFNINHFYFHGFLPHKTKEKSVELDNLKNIPCPVVIYESPYRVQETLSLILEKNFNTPISVTREATKLHEETVFIYDKTDIEKLNIKGEFVIVINNIQESSSNSIDTDYETLAAKLLQENLTSKNVITVLKTLGAKRNDAYSIVNNLQNKK